MRIYTLILASSFLFLQACQTSMIRSFENVHAGMDKHQVLDKMGTPDSTSRLHGKDRWIYRFYESGIRHEKEIHFLEGTVVYIGDPWVAPKGQSAKEKDDAVAVNEKQIEESEKLAKKQKAEALANYESEIRGDKKVKYIPQFTEIK